VWDCSHSGKSFFLRPEVGRWPSDIGVTVGLPYGQLDFLFRGVIVRLYAIL